MILRTSPISFARGNRNPFWFTHMMPFLVHSLVALFGSLASCTKILHLAVSRPFWFTHRLPFLVHSPATLKSCIMCHVPIIVGRRGWNLSSSSQNFPGFDQMLTIFHRIPTAAKFPSMVCQIWSMTAFLIQLCRCFALQPTRSGWGHVHPTPLSNVV